MAENNHQTQSEEVKKKLRQLNWDVFCKATDDVISNAKRNVRITEQEDIKNYIPQLLKLELLPNKQHWNTLCRSLNIMTTEEREQQQSTKTLNVAVESNKIAKEANTIASKASKTALVAIIFSIISIAVAIFAQCRSRDVNNPPSINSTQLVYSICKDCGLFGIEIDQLIEQLTDSGLSAPEAEQLWVDTADPDATEICRPCVIALIEAAG